LVAVDGLEVDLGRRTVTVDGRSITLARKEFEILALLARADGAAVPRDRIVVEVWQTTYDGMSRTLDVHVATLRGKLGRAGGLVQTVRGFGYRLSAGPGVARGRGGDAGPGVDSGGAEAGGPAAAGE
ncbi:winged helix-turn-helix domain-containing protein, partial [Streptomyces sp. NPDC006365]|uniref:winged helix-turn-helix domain-containing protein n=1 Tax=Streptomyces sp. NPDC006365 TaxID=3364744 RepID=UPI00367544DB